MPRFQETIDIDADPDATWSVLGDLASVDRWLPGIARVEVDGMTRVCTFADGRVQREQISDYSADTRSYRYAIEGGLPVRDNRAASPSRRVPAARAWCGSRASSRSTAPRRPS